MTSKGFAQLIGWVFLAVGIMGFFPAFRHLLRERFRIWPSMEGSGTCWAFSRLIGSITWCT